MKTDLIVVILLFCTIFSCGSRQKTSVFIEERVSKLTIDRLVDSTAILLEPGYAITAVVTRRNFAIDITFDSSGTMFIAEAGAHCMGTSPLYAPPPRIIRLRKGGIPQILYDVMVPFEQIRDAGFRDPLPEGLIPPVNGITWHKGLLYIRHRTRISTLNPVSGEFTTIIDHLPEWGYIPTGKVLFDKNDKMVFFIPSQGNAGPVDEHWNDIITLYNKPLAREIPGETVTLVNNKFQINTDTLLDMTSKAGTPVSAFFASGVSVDSTSTLPGSLICNGGFFRADPDGNNITRIAWGFSSSTGYRISPGQQLFAAHKAAGTQRPRAIVNDAAAIYEVIENQWYGWPDFFNGVPVTDKRFCTPLTIPHFIFSDSTHRLLLHGETTPLQPLFRLSPGCEPSGLVFGNPKAGISENNLLIADCGSLKSQHPAGVLRGFCIEKVNLADHSCVNFAVNKSGRPSSLSTSMQGGFERPVQLEWGVDNELYVVDFGEISVTEKGMEARPGTSVIWKIRAVSGSSTDKK